VPIKKNFSLTGLIKIIKEPKKKSPSLRKNGAEMEVAKYLSIKEGAKKRKK